MRKKYTWPSPRYVDQYTRTIISHLFISIIIYGNRRK